MATVALVGRPNVGKSTLFNRLVGGRRAIVHEQPGVTRDRLYGQAEWRGRHFTVIDTGGIEPEGGAPLTGAVRRQAEFALNEADVVIFLVDAEAGLTPADEEVARLLRPARKPVLLVVNKVDNPQREMMVVDFYRLGMGEPIPLSAEHGRNVSSLLDRVAALLPEPGAELEPAVAVAILGRPNVGKSTLLNALAGEERAVVSDIPGTTRDALDTLLSVDGQVYRLIDTAGLRRRGRRGPALEYYSMLRAIRAVEQADVALLLLEAPAGVTHQDQTLAAFTREAGKGIVVLVNKWDLLEKRVEGTGGDRLLRAIKERLTAVPYAPILSISARTGRHLDRIFPTVRQVEAARTRRVPTARLNEVVQDAIERHHPPAIDGRRLKVYYAVQTGVEPPAFDLFCNFPDRLVPDYRRYLENRLREAFDFTGTPIVLRARPRRR